LTFNSVNLGHTQGAVSVHYEPHFRDKNVDAYGDTPVGSVLVGELLEITVSLAEWSYTILKAVCPLAYDGTTYLRFGKTVGDDLYDSAAELTVHPLEQDGTDYDLTIWKAAPKPNFEITYSNDGDRIFNVTFVAFPDTTKADKQRLFQMGTP